MSENPALKKLEDGKNVHISVGALIRNEEGEYLIIDRLNEPLGWAFPAGHVEHEERAFSAFLREVKEETGLEVIASQLITKTLILEDICSRGIEGHYWHLYHCTKTQGALKIDSGEAKNHWWLSLNQIYSSLNNFNLVSKILLEQNREFFYR